MRVNKFLVIPLSAIILQGCITTSVREGLPQKTKTYYSDKPVILFIMDTSGSMSGLQADSNISKIDTAKTSIINTINQIDNNKFNTSLITFNKESCEADLIFEPNNNNSNGLAQKINTIEPQGPTPLAKAIALSGKVLDKIDKKMIVLLSDGEESCNGDPVEEARILNEKYGINISIQLIGYSVDNKVARKLQAIADINNEWGYHSAKDPIEIKKILFKIMKSALKGCWKNSFTCSFQFSTGSSALNNAYLSDIQDMYSYLKDNNEKVTIIGHTDNVGTDSSNIILSLKRADMVRKELIRLGISPERIDVSGMGEKTPITTNLTDEGRKQNRRVEIKILE